MIDIIIAAYNAHNTLGKALDSILMQSISDKIKVYIVDDKSDKNYNEIVKQYGKYLDITELTYDENMGPGFARNYGLDHSDSEYVMFLDSDDIFFSHYSIEILYEKIKSNNLDLVIGNFVEEVAECKYIPHFKDTIWDHGKIYRRKYLDENNIRFTNERSNEDLYFNFLTVYTGAKYEFIDAVTYIWQNNRQSITRKNDHEFNHSGIDGYIRNIYNLSVALEERKISKSTVARILFFGMLQMYYTYIMFDKNNDKSSIDILMNATKNIAKRYSDFEKHLTDEDKNELLRKELEKYMNTRNLHLVVLNDKSFRDFVKEVSTYEK